MALGRPGDPGDPENFPPYVCGNSVCALACPAGQTSCNRSCRNLQTDNTSCGTCGNVCAAGATCTSGVCVSPPKASCNAIKQATPASPSGVYTIDPDGAGGAIAPFPVYCDMTTNGGGWTLILKAHPASGNFHYFSPLWTNSATHNPGATAFDQTEAKFQSFSTVPFTNVLVGMRDGGAVRYVTLTKSSSSMQAMLSGGFNGTSVGRNAWKGLMASGSLQPYRRRATARSTAFPGSSCLCAAHAAGRGERGDRAGSYAPLRHEEEASALVVSPGAVLVFGHAEHA